MDRRDFIRAAYQVVYQGSVSAGFQMLMQKPAGRHPPSERVRIHDWYRNLSLTDQEVAQLLVQQIAEQATYVFLLVLDHKLTIESGENKGSFELYYRGHDGSRVLLNETNAEDFSYLFKQFRETHQGEKGAIDTP